jgi:hypothetical protein
MLPNGYMDDDVLVEQIITRNVTANWLGVINAAFFSFHFRIELYVARASAGEIFRPLLVVPPIYTGARLPSAHQPKLPQLDLRAVAAAANPRCARVNRIQNPAQVRSRWVPSPPPAAGWPIGRTTGAQPNEGGIKERDPAIQQPPLRSGPSPTTLPQSSQPASQPRGFLPLNPRPLTATDARAPRGRGQTSPRRTYPSGSSRERRRDARSRTPPLRQK